MPANDSNSVILAELENLKSQLAQAKSDYEAKSEALNRSQELANIGSWDLEVSSGTLSWSDQVFNIFGLASEGFEVTYEAFLNSIHPDDREMVNKAYSDAMANKTPYDVVHRVLRPDGTVRVVRETSRDMLGSSGAVVRSMGIVHDITEQHAIQQALEEKERFLSTLMDNVPGLVYRCGNSPGWPMEYLSQGCFKLTGYHPSELMSPSKRNFSSIIHPDDTQRVIDEVRSALKDKVFYEITHRIITARGEERWVWVHGQGIYDEQGEVQALEGFLTDYSKIINEQKKRLSLERTFMENQKLESLGLMAGGIAHDFNNLLTVILGNVDMALEDVSSESAVKKHLSQIETASHRASDLAHQMLAYSGQTHFVTEAIHINEILLEMTQMMDLSISKTGLLKMELKENLPMFEGDVAQIRQIILNLISNASEAMEKQYATITVTSGSQWCDRAYLDGACANHLMIYENPIPEGHYVFFEVSDTGPGMEQVVLDRVFDPFFTTKFTGRGLGLAATLGCIRSHRGTLQVTSKPGTGTAFKILIPARELNVQPENLCKTDGIDETRQGNGVILFADDEPMVREMGQTMLQRMGYEVITAPDGQEAIQLFTQYADKISLVLLDLTMPVMGGMDALREISAHKPETKVILCSGYMENEINDDDDDVRFSGYLQKPFTFDDLQREIKKALG